MQLGDALARRFANVGISEAQGNPFQPDIQVRGFTLSPLLGLPQGVAVFQDGVRVNEPFGDTLHWDLLPDNAIATVDLMPGSNPLFGRNALGGAIADPTKTGWTDGGNAPPLTPDRSAGTGSSSTAARTAIASVGSAPRACWRRTAGATTRHRACARSSAAWRREEIAAASTPPPPEERID